MLHVCCCRGFGWIAWVASPAAILGATMFRRRNLTATHRGVVFRPWPSCRQTCCFFFFVFFSSFFFSLAQSSLTIFHEFLCKMAPSIQTLFPTCPTNATEGQARQGCQSHHHRNWKTSLRLASPGAKCCVISISKNTYPRLQKKTTGLRKTERIILEDPYLRVFIFWFWQLVQTTRLESRTMLDRLHRIGIITNKLRKKSFFKVIMSISSWNWNSSFV